MCKDAKILLVVSTLFTFAMGLSNIFVNIFFWKQTNDYIVIAIYHLTHYLFTPITFIIAGMIAKKKNGIWSLRLGLCMYALFFTLILVIGGRGIFYIYFLGIIYGMATGFYWLSFNTLSFDFTHVNNRDTFNGFNGSCAGIASAVSPIVGAYVISRLGGARGYNLVFTLTLSIFIALTVISIFLRCKNYGVRLDLKKAFSKNCIEWSIIRKSTAVWGFRDVIIAFLVNILIIETTGSELSLGKLALIGSLTSSASYMIVQRVIKPPRRRLAILIGTVGSFGAVLALAMGVNYRSLLIYTIADAFFLPFFLIQLSSSTFNVINRVHEEDMRVEYMINKDIVLNTGRVVSSFILIILLYTFKDPYALSIYLAFIGLLPVISGYFLGKLRRVLEGK